MATKKAGIKIDWLSYGISEVYEAEDGGEALAIALKEKPDIVITDIRMPGLSGIDLMKKLNENSIFSKMIVVSGYDDFEYAQGALRAGAANYLLKPVDEEELLDAELARLAGASKIIMVEIAKPRIEIAKKMIPDIIVINPKEQDTVEEVKRITNGRGANVVITALSVPSAHTEAQIIAAKRGRISLFGGIAGDGKGYLDSNLIHYKELSIHGVHATTAGMMKEIIRYVEN